VLPGEAPVDVAAPVGLEVVPAAADVPCAPACCGARAALVECATLRDMTSCSSGPPASATPRAARTASASEAEPHRADAPSVDAPPDPGQCHGRARDEPRARVSERVPQTLLQRLIQESVTASLRW